MGAGQSAQGPGGARQPAQEVKTSYYELLEIDKQATDDEIKKAYRRRALLLHPDRNYGDVERTTALFASVQSAYEVLSDPQDRAWYDAHEDAILRDIDPTASSSSTDANGTSNAYEHNVGLTTGDDITRLIRRFHGGVEFTDAPSGFYGFLREVFAQLAKEEVIAALRNDTANNAEHPPDYPSFGHASDTYDAVARPFYAAWAGFSTCKSFAWRDRYRASEAEDRRTRRAIEKENASYRREGVQELNDAVRALVAFVKKRDPRYTAGADTRSEVERQQVLRDAAQAQAARMRKRNEEMMRGDAVPEWAKAGESGAAGDESAALEGKLGESSSSEEEHFECMACRKTFKSERRFEAHEKSKKHVKAVWALRRKLEKEGHVFGVDEDADEGEDVGVEEEPQEDNWGARTNGAQDQHQGVSEDDGPNLDDNSHEDDEPSKFGATEDRKSPHPNGTSTSFRDNEDDTDDDSDVEQNAPAIDNDQADASRPTSPSSLRAQTARLDTSPQSASPSSSSTPPPSTSTSTSPPPAAQAPSSAPAPTPPTKGAAALKRAKRASAQAAADADDGNRHKCTVCAAGFPSKTRLFQHVAKRGHARAPAAADGGGGGCGGSGKGKKGRRKG